MRLSSVEPCGDGWLAQSDSDSNGRYSGYVYLGSDNSIEMVGVLKVGPWFPESRTWWPGTYELQLLKQLPTSIRQLIDQLDLPAPAYLFMNLIAISGTAIVTESDDGTERPFPIPAHLNTIKFAPVFLDKLASREETISSLNKIRQVIGLKTSRPFYL